MVAGKQYPLFFERKTKVLVCMAGRVQRGQMPSRSFEYIAFGYSMLGCEPVASPRSVKAVSACAGGALNGFGGRPVVGMRMRDQDLLNRFVAERMQDRLSVAGKSRA